MESPINPKVPQFIMKAALGAISATVLFSVYHQRYRMLSATNELFSELRHAKDTEGKLRCMKEITDSLQEDAMAKKAPMRLSSERHGKDLLGQMKLKEDGSNEAVVSAAAKLITRVFSQSDEGKREMARLGGPKVIVKSLSVAHAQGFQSVLEELALTLRELTTFDEEKVVLQNDVPEGADCALALARTPSIVNMLAVLDPESPTGFLSSVVSVLANICALHVGAKRIAKGCHGRSGMSFFLRLLDHSNLTVVGKSIEAIAYLCRANCSRGEIAELENIQRLSSNFAVNSDKALVAKVLTIVMMMAGDEKYGKAFFAHLPETAMIRTMFDLWVSASDPETRGRAEMVACLCLQVPSTSNHTMELLQAYRRQITERAQKDEAERQKRQQEMQQQQFMQRMMMEQMGMGMM